MKYDLQIKYMKEKQMSQEEGRETLKSWLDGIDKVSKKRTQRTRDSGTSSVNGHGGWFARIEKDGEM